jgi:hypothetical protein
LISININKWRNYFSIKNIFGTASILFYVLNPIPIIYNVHIADVFMLLYFILNIFSIYKHSFSSIVYRNIFPIFVLFILFSLISGFNAYNIETHILAIFQFVFVFFIVIPSLLYFLVNDVSKILKLFLIGSFISICLLLLYYLFGFTLTNYFNYALTGGAEIQRIGIGSVMDMGFLMACSGIMIHQLLINKIISKNIFLIYSVICGFILILIAARAAIVMVIIYYFFIMLFSSIKTRLIYLVSVIGIILSLYFYFNNYESLLYNNILRLMSLTESSSLSNSARYQDYKNLIIYGYNNPLGLGYNNYQIVYQKTPIHNSFAIIFLEGGFISFILFSSIWLLTLYFLFKNKPWFKGKAEIAIIISYLFYISTISNVYDRMFWLIVVYVFAMIDKNRFTYFYKLKAT